MVSSIGSGFDANRLAEMQKRMFTKLDTNSDGGISLDEFKAGASKRHGGQGGMDPTKLFGQIDTSGDGSISQDENAAFISGMMSQQAQGALLDAQERASEMFAKLDANGDGGIDLDEFKAGAPKDRQADDTKASEMFAKIDTNGDGKVDPSENQAFMSQMGPPPPPPPAEGDGGDATSLFNSLDTNGDGVISAEELAAAFNSEKSGTASTQSASGSSSSSSALLEQIRAMIDRYRSGSALSSTLSSSSGVSV